MHRKQKLLVSIRGPVEAIEAAKGGAHIADVEYPASALGTPYPLNVWRVRKKLDGNGYRHVMVSTNIGEIQQVRASSCQAVLGVAVAGADLIKFGLAEQSLEAAIYLSQNIVRTVHKLSPKKKKLFPAVFVDDDMQRFLKPFEEAEELVVKSRADGILIDTFNKLIGKGLLDYCSLKEVSQFVKQMHRQGKEAWIAGSITKEELPDLWSTGVDVICVRSAACKQSNRIGRFGSVDVQVVRQLVATMPR